MRRHERLIVAAAILALFALWEGLARLGLVDPSLAPAPSVVAAALVRLAGRPEVLASLGVTAWEVAAAFLLATPLGLGLGFTESAVLFEELCRPSARSSVRSSTSSSGYPSRSSCPCSSWCSG